MLHIKNLAKSFGNLEALGGVSLKVSAGSVYTLIGPNGSGKTTLIKLVAGLMHADSGHIEIGGKDIDTSPKEIKAQTGYIPDNPKIWDKMTGNEFLDFTGVLYGMEKKAREARIKELLPIFSLESVGDTYFEHYSRGNRQKFAILAALLPNPQLLLVDEPIVGLDPESAQKTTALFRDFADTGGAVLVVTHTLGAVEGITDHLGILKEGALVADGTLPELRVKAGLDEEAGLGALYGAFAKSGHLSEK